MGAADVPALSPLPANVFCGNNKTLIISMSESLEKIDFIILSFLNST
jgi:hypothetical protein